LCGGLPGAGATMGTVVNIQTGAKTAVSGLTRALILLYHFTKIMIHLRKGALLVKNNE
jgi:MFS superfamily sulfate permease-like transporter